MVDFFGATGGLTVVPTDQTLINSVYYETAYGLIQNFRSVHPEVLKNW